MANARRNESETVLVAAANISVLAEYSSVLLRPGPSKDESPPAMRTLPFGARVAVILARATFMVVWVVVERGF